MEDIMTTDIPCNSEFSRELTKIILERKPKIALETGTYQGTGSSRIILDALGKLSCPSIFYTIEINGEFADEARVNLNINCPDNVRVYVLHGLSISRILLPEPWKVQELVNDAKLANVHVDHNGKDEVMYYMKETGFLHQDSMLDDVLDLEPDFILLDSGGHIGEIEFCYVLHRLSYPCIIALDDTMHLKHYKSLQRMKRDPRFSILVESSERFGFVIAEFKP